MSDFEKLQKERIEESKKKFGEKKKKAQAAKQARKIMLGKLYTQEHDRLSQMVLVPAGPFVMGSQGGNPDEQPTHTVSLRAFYIDKYEVTQVMYLKVMDDDPSFFKNCPLCPVDTVIWKDARKYCTRIKKRLPSEAEWEKAARAGSLTKFYWGDTMDGSYAWYRNNANAKTHPIGQKKPNGYGLYDMAGNVSEWVADRYLKDFYRKGPAKNPRGPLKKQAKSNARVLRGSSWANMATKLRSATRGWNMDETRNNTQGFRCIRYVAKK